MLSLRAVSSDPCDPIASGNTDTDGDGISDICDLDDDNDGILDVDEGCGQITNFSNTDKGYLTQGNSGLVYTVDLNTGTAVLIDTLGFRINAISFNEADGLLWGVNRSTQLLVSVDENFTVVNTYGSIGSNSVAGAYDPVLKRIVISEDGQSRTYVIDGDPTSASYGNILYSFTAGYLRCVDIAYNAIDSKIYGIELNTNNLIQIDIVNQTFTNIGAVTNLPVANNYGAAYALADGKMYFSDNTTGNIYEVIYDGSNTPNATFVVAGPASSNNDGAKFLYVDLNGNNICIGSVSYEIPPIFPKKGEEGVLLMCNLLIVSHLIFLLKKIKNFS